MFGDATMLAQIYEQLIPCYKLSVNEDTLLPLTLGSVDECLNHLRQGVPPEIAKKMRAELMSMMAPMAFGLRPDLPKENLRLVLISCILLARDFFKQITLKLVYDSMTDPFTTPPSHTDPQYVDAYLMAEQPEIERVKAQVRYTIVPSGVDMPKYPSKKHMLDLSVRAFRNASAVHDLAIEIGSPIHVPHMILWILEFDKQAEWMNKGTVTKAM